MTQGDRRLYYVHSRWYDPPDGWFINEDPIGPLVGGRDGMLT
jgi:hypothetical protein